MTAASQQIVTAFEDVGLTPEAIAAEYEYEVSVVKATLAQYSSKYRSAATKDDDLGFKDDEAKEMQDIILQIARYSEDDNLRFKAARYVRDDKKGRLDLIKQLPGLNISVLAFNAQMQKANEAIARAKQISATVASDPEPVNNTTIDSDKKDSEVLEAVVAD